MNQTDCCNVQETCTHMYTHAQKMEDSEVWLSISYLLQVWSEGTGLHISLRQQISSVSQYGMSFW